MLASRNHIYQYVKAQRACNSWIELQFLAMIDFNDIFFFFQAEDGIRDYKVTGVQTCALPILAMMTRRPAAFNAARASGVLPLTGSDTASKPASCPSTAKYMTLAPSPRRVSEIGRASCRERV